MGLISRVSSRTYRFNLKTMANDGLPMSEIQNLTDQVLRNKLKENGVNCGPIGKLRKTYEKRLFKAVNGHEYGKPATSKNTSTPAKKAASPSRKQSQNRSVNGSGDSEIHALSKPRKQSPARK